MARSSFSSFVKPPIFRCLPFPKPIRWFGMFWKIGSNGLTYGAATSCLFGSIPGK